MRLRLQPLAALSTQPIALGSDKKTLPDRLLVAPWGVSETRLGKVIVNETTLAQLGANQAAAKFDRVAFDFQHATVKAKPGDEPIKVAGYGTPEVVAGEGIYLSAIEYTDEGKRVLPEGHYPDLSPTVLRNEKGEVIFLHSVGAVRQGEIDGLTLFGAPAAALLAALNAEMPGESAGWREILVGLLNALGAEPELDAAAASDAQIARTAETLSESLSKNKPKTPEKKTNPDPALAAMSAEKITSLEERLVALEASQSTSRRDALVAQASREGKVIPLSAEDIAKCDLAILEAMIPKLPVTVPMESRLTGALDNFAATPGAAGLTPEEKAVADQLGIAHEDLAKTPRNR